MRGWKRWLTVAVLGAMISETSCRQKPRGVLVQDSERRRVEVACDASGHCSFSQVGGPQPTAPGELAVHATGVVLSLCNVPPTADSTVDPRDCRPLRCDRDEECPPAHGLQHAPCIRGLCVEADQTLTQGDVVVLCLAGTGLRKDDDPTQIDRYALAVNSGEPPRVPKPCLQP